MRQPTNSQSWWGNPVLYGPDMQPPYAPRMAPPPPFDPMRGRAEWMAQPRPQPTQMPQPQMPQPPPPQSPFGAPPLSPSWQRQAQNPPGEMMPSSQQMAPPPLEIGQRGGNPFPPFPQPSYPQQKPPPPRYEPQQMYVPAGDTFQYDPAIHGPTNSPEPLDPELGPYQGRTPYEPPWGGGYIFLE